MATEKKASPKRSRKKAPEAVAEGEDSVGVEKTIFTDLKISSKSARGKVLGVLFDGLNQSISAKDLADGTGDRKITQKKLGGLIKAIEFKLIKTKAPYEVVVIKRTSGKVSYGLVDAG